jgi:indole-3-glycerol phosphate synthase
LTTYLDAIVAAHRADAARDRRDLDDLVVAAAGEAPPRDFVGALSGADGLAVIAEIKRRSPSKGALAPDLDPTTLAQAYALGGATCLSVLTDEAHFGGSADDLRAARSAVELPVLRKDFTVSERDVCDARIMGADCILLIVAALGDPELVAFSALARRLDLAVLFEVHDEPELERALAAGADLVGVNQRDLVTFEVDTDRAVRLAPLIPDELVRVAESGVRGRDDAARLADAGYDAVLVGESLVTSDDAASGVAGLRAVDRR